MPSTSNILRRPLRGAGVPGPRLLGESVAADARAERERGLKVLGVHRRFLLDRDVHVRRRLLGAVGGENCLVDLFLAPALIDRLGFDLGEFAVANALDHADTFAFRLDRCIGDRLCVDLRSGGFNRLRRSFRIRVLRFHNGVSFQFQ